MSLYLIEFLGLAIAQILYLKLAGKIGIIDVPNHRSSHNENVIRGGGVVIYLSVLFHQLATNFLYPYFFVGLTMISIISFWDDISPLPNRLRIIVHTLGVGLLLYQSLIPITWWSLVLLVVSIGILNTFNFMDGINGMTGFYGLVFLVSFLVLNMHFQHVVDTHFLLITIMGLAVFGFYNFRSRAICFAGDVGSMSLALIVIFCLALIIHETGNYVFILLLAVYGVDSVLTIIMRLIRKENIFRAHRSHLYQFLVNIKELPHLRVSAGYAMLQVFINVLLLCNLKYEVVSSMVLFVVVISSLSAVYLVLVPRLTGKPIFRRA